MSGPESPHDSFGARTPWTAGAAATFAVIAVVLALVAARMAQPLHAPVGDWLAGARVRPGLDGGHTVNTMLTTLVLHVVLIALVYWGAARFGGERRRLLSLETLPTAATTGLCLAAMLALLGPYNLLIYLMWPEHFAADMRPFWELARGPAIWLAALVLVVLAPVSEELLFRGFLLPALTKTRWGFTGAAVMSSAGWTVLHGYSFAGVIEVFAIGLFLAWTMRRYGSLWLPLALHAIYNGGQLALLVTWPE
jgi:membrane protease YdiL (CAAX protease family)